MFVLELGSNAIKNDTKIVCCDDCGSRFIYNDDDLITVYNIETNNFDVGRFVKCPICGRHIKVDKYCKDTKNGTISN